MKHEQNNEKRKIVVMGGSFNPPTIAHQKLMLAAVEALQAEMGVFVPSSHEYVKRKMNRAKHPEEVIDEDLRFQMLSKMAEEDPRLTVDNYEYHLTQKSRTYDTMVYLMEKYSDAELFFLAGGDKIDIFPRWYRIKDFLEQFHIIVTNREDYDAETALLENPFLSLYRNRFVVIDYPEGIGNISSSVVRERFRESDYEAVREMLHSEVYEIIEMILHRFLGKCNLVPLSGSNANIMIGDAALCDVCVGCHFDVAVVDARSQVKKTVILWFFELLNLS